ncbi:MAG: glycoside hydrolase family 36 N-terminal domain-containing protein, partial [Ornithinimicrobium sp.]
MTRKVTDTGAGSGDQRGDGLEVLRGGGSSLILLRRPDGLPEIVHWGADLGDLDDDTLAVNMVLAGAPATPQSGLDDAWPLTLLPSETDGWSGRPGITAHREGRTTIPRFANAAITRSENDHDIGGAEVMVHATDERAEIGWSCRLRLDTHGVLSMQHSVTNTGEEILSVAGLLAIMPLPSTAGEVMDLTGRWCRERHPQRAALHHGGKI